MIHCQAQMIIVIDNEDLKPIPDVAVMNEGRNKYIYSNRLGKVDISSFDKNETICFHHFTYESACLSPDEIKKSGFEIRLKKKIFAIEEFVISANRWEQNRNEVPNKIVTILQPIAELLNPQTSADLLASSDEIFIQKSQLGGGSPMIRGFATNRVLIVVDGVRMNNAIYREGNIQNVISIDPAMLESTEIIFGPGASVYGSDAIGGVMDFHTKKALLSTGNKQYFKLDAFSRYSSANNEKSFHLDFNLGGKKVAFLSGFTWSDFGDLKMGSVRNDNYLRPEYAGRYNGRDSVFINPDPEIQKFSGYSQLNTLNKLRYKISGNLDISFSNHFSRLSNVPRYDRLIQYRSGKLRYAEWYYGPQVWMMNSLQAAYSGKTRVFDEVKIIASQQLYKESRHDRAFGKTNVNEQYETVNILSLNIDFDKKIDKEKELIYYGFELVRNGVISDAETRNIVTGTTTPAGSRYPDGDNDYLSYAAYLGYKKSLLEKVHFNTGLRYSHVSLRSEIADNSFYNFPFTSFLISNGAVTGAAGVVYRVNEKLQLNINASTGFRAPNLDDAGKIFESAPGVVVVPNPGLKPEYAWNIDIGISKDFYDAIHFEISGFHTWLDNAMIRHDFQFNGESSIVYQGELSRVEAVTNAGSARAYGIHSGIRVNLTGGWSIKSAINVTEGKEKGGIPLRHAAPVFGSTHLILDKPRLKTDLYASYNGAKVFSKMPPSEIEKAYLYSADSNGNPWSPAWWTLNIKLSYTFVERVVVTAGMENILNNRYRPYSSGISAPGRNLILSVRLKI